MANRDPATNQLENFKGKQTVNIVYLFLYIRHSFTGKIESNYIFKDPLHYDLFSGA